MKRGIAILFSLGAAAVVSAQDVPALPTTATGSGTSGVSAASASVAGVSSGIGDVTTPSGFSFEALQQLPDGRALLANASPDYPVTPGDIYTLTFLKAADTATLSLVVQSDYRVNLGVFGTTGAQGMSFPAFKNLVENKVASAYPGSSPLLIVQATGVFDIKVEGEVVTAKTQTCWALQRLSSVVADNDTSYSSYRRVVVRSAGGQERAFDLFRAQRDGDLSQDPYVRPGDEIRLARVQRQVKLMGAVYRPGSYELLPGEGLAELVQRYGAGFAPDANPDRILATRAPASGATVGETSYLKVADAGSWEVRPFDTYVVPTVSELKPTVYFEGALGIGVNGEDPQAARRIPYVFTPGETLSHAVQVLRAQFSAVSDLPSAYIINGGGSRRPIDLTNFLYNKDYSVDPPLVADDTIVIPFRQFFVSVSGAVRIPGRYPYVPDRDWRYYVMLAGGFDTDKNSGDKVTVRDVEGRTRSQSDRPIEPEDSIDAASNSFFFVLGKVSSVLTTVLSVVSVILYISKL